MSRIEGISPQRAGFFLRLFYRAATRIAGRLTGTAALMEPFTVVAHQPRLIWGSAAMEQALNGCKLLPASIKLMANMAAARTVGCAYCMDVGPVVARRQGIEERQIVELLDFETSTAFDDAERAAIRYTIALSSTPVRVSDATFAELRRHFTPAQIVELTAVAAWENQRGRFNHALELTPQGFSEGAYCLLPPTPVQSSIHAPGV